MNPANVKEILEGLGLSETEARVYYSMLELGPASVQNIAKKSNVSRTAAYDIISSLQAKGIASSFQKDKKKLFSAEDPVRLQAYFKNRLASMRDKLQGFKSLMPELRLMAAGDKPKVRYYSGFVGVEALMRDVLSVKVDELLDFSDSEVIHRVLSQIDSKKLLAIPGYEKIPVRNMHRGELRASRPITKYKQIPDSVKSFGGDVFIYANRVAFLDFSGNIDVIIIENKVFADTARVMFNLLWDSLE